MEIIFYCLGIDLPYLYTDDIILFNLYYSFKSRANICRVILRHLQHKISRFKILHSSNKLDFLKKIIFTLTISHINFLINYTFLFDNGNKSYHWKNKLSIFFWGSQPMDNPKNTTYLVFSDYFTYGVYNQLHTLIQEWKQK